jgi:hypothetical protein
MFHNLCDFIKEELKELDHKVASGSRLSSQEIQYADLLAHMKKSLLTVDAMENPEEYGSYGDDRSSGNYGAGGRMRPMRRYGMTGYGNSKSYMDNGLKDEIYELMDKAPNDRVRRKLEELASEMDK